MARFVGASFPFRRGSTGFPEPGTDDQLIKESLIQLLMTGTGERVMRPTVGTNIKRFLFEPNDELLASLIQAEISSAVARFEPRVTLSSIDVFRQEADVIITVSYVVNATQTLDALSVRV